MRPGDLFDRLGGEEFACLVANATAQALHTAERLRHEFEAMRFPGLEGNATVSIGVAMASEAGRSLPALLAIADRALYRAKADGRNRVAPAPWSWSTSAPAKPRAGRRNEQPRWRRPRPGRTGYALAASSVTFICVLNCFKFIELCFRLFVTLFGSLAKPRHSECKVLRNPPATLVCKTEAVSSVRESVFGGLAIPSDGLLIVLRDTSTVCAHRAKTVLRKRVSLISGLAVPCDCLLLVLGDAFTVQVHKAEPVL